MVRDASLRDAPHHEEEFVSIRSRAVFAPPLPDEPAFATATARVSTRPPKPWRRRKDGRRAPSRTEIAALFPLALFCRVAFADEAFPRSHGSQRDGGPLLITMDIPPLERQLTGGRTIENPVIIDSSHARYATQPGRTSRPRDCSAVRDARRMSPSSHFANSGEDRPIQEHFLRFSWASMAATVAPLAPAAMVRDARPIDRAPHHEDAFFGA